MRQSYFSAVVSALFMLLPTMAESQNTVSDNHRDFVQRTNLTYSSNLVDCIRENLHYPAIARENGIEGRIKVSLIVDEDGNVMSVKIIEGLGAEFDKAVITMLTRMPVCPPKIQNGKRVATPLVIPIRFCLR
jgi:TonB family protein